MLKGEDGFLRKEFEKLLEWLASEPRAGRHPPAELAADRASRRRLRRALKAPVRCTLQGEDLFLDGLTEPHRAEALDLIRKNAASVDRFIAVSDYYADFMAEVSVDSA